MDNRATDPGDSAEQAGKHHLAVLIGKLRRNITKQRFKWHRKDRGLKLENLYKYVAVFPEARLAYNRIKKCGNTRIAAFLNDVLLHRSYASSGAMKRGLIKAAALSYSELLALDSYYSIVFVRHPYGRVLSVFLDKLAQGGKAQMPTYGHRPGFGDNSRAGFRAFLDYLAAGGLHDDPHWWPQFELLYQPVAAFSFIGRLERMVPDMRQILLAIGQDPDLATALDAPHALEANRKGAMTKASSRLDEYYTEEGRAIVRQLYRADFEGFGYEG